MQITFDPEIQLPKAEVGC